MPKRSKKQQEAVALDDEDPSMPQSLSVSSEAKGTTSFATYPVPREVLADPDLLEEHVRPGYVHFVNGYDRDFVTQAVDWSTMWSDAQRPYYTDEERKTALPMTSWPPSFNLRAPEQQYQSETAKPVHGGFTWPGHPAPLLPTFEGLKEGVIDRLPGPLQKFFYS